MRRTIVAGFGALAVLFATVSAVSQACGDKLFALGGGVSFKRVMSARHPGDILLYVTTGSQLQIADTELGLRAALERAGHHVRAVHDEASLTAAIATMKPDLVLMDWSEAGAYRATHAATAGGVAVLGVRYRDASGAQRAANEGCIVDAEQKSGRQVVSTISDILSRRSKGLSPRCNQAA